MAASQRGGRFAWIPDSWGPAGAAATATTTTTANDTTGRLRVLRPCRCARPHGENAPLPGRHRRGPGEGGQARHERVHRPRAAPRARLQARDQDRDEFVDVEFVSFGPQAV